MQVKVSTRVVLVFKSFVVKLPISKRGYLQGKNEGKLYDKYKDTQRLAQLKWERFGIVCMKRYDVCTSIPFTVVKRYKDSMSELNVTHCDLHNHKNWGLREGKYYILLDYGIDERVSKMY